MTAGGIVAIGLVAAATGIGVVASGDQPTTTAPVACTIEAVIDYGHRGTHATAVAGEALTAAFYGTSPPQHSFSCVAPGRAQ